MTDSAARIPRRYFLGSLAMTGAALALPGAALHAMDSTTSFPTGPDDWDHSWLDRLTAKHRAFFDNKSVGGDTLAYPKRYYDAMLDGYGAAAKDVQVVIGFAGAGWATAITDEGWAQWGLTASVNGNPPGRNPVRGTAGDNAATATTITAWQQRGAIFLVCNNSLRKAAAELAAKTTDGDAAVVYAALRAAILPEFTVVPAMVAALAMAQERKCAYLVGS